MGIIFGHTMCFFKILPIWRLKLLDVGRLFIADFETQVKSFCNYINIFHLHAINKIKMMYIHTK